MRFSPSQFLQATIAQNPLVSGPLQAVSSLGYGSLVALARSSVLSLFSRIQVGTLTIKDDSDRSIRHFGDDALIAALSRGAKSDNASPKEGRTKGVHATLHVRKDAFWLRMFFGADLGFSEAYMAGEVDTPSLGDCFDVSEGGGPISASTGKLIPHLKIADLPRLALPCLTTDILIPPPPSTPPRPAYSSSSSTIELHSPSLTLGPRRA